MQIDIHNGPVEPEITETLSKLFEDVFCRPPAEGFGERLNEKLNLLVLIATVSGKAVGFKIGYEKHRGTFFSWLGGVLPQYRNQGIARELMKEQHELCRRQGYMEVQTETEADGREMLILNLQEGYVINGLQFTRDKRLMVQLTKPLAL